MCARLERTGRRVRRGGPRRARGVSLVELAISIAIVGVLAGTLWSAWSLLSARSVDPLVARQALLAGQSLLGEIELQPLPGRATAAALPGRTGFASIADYHGLALSGITDAEGQAIAGLEGYSAGISVTSQSLSGAPGWWIAVTVTGPGGHRLELGQWRADR